MRRLPKAGIGLVLMAVAAFAFLGASGREAQARPQYMKEFKNIYGEKQKDSNCLFCHPSKDDKKQRNEYGKAVGSAIAAKNTKDVEKIKAGIEKVGGEMYEGKTYKEYFEGGGAAPK